MKGPAHENLKSLDLKHHAYCLIGDQSIREELKSFLETEHDMKTQGNPDFFDRSFAVFTIDDARELKSLAESKPVLADGRKVFILATSGITNEAQNALLKLLEEPPVYAVFFLIVPSAHLLLPTVKSRVQVVDINSAPKDSELKKFASSFLNMSVTERMNAVKSFMDEIAKEKRDKNDAVEVMAILEELVHKKGVNKENKANLEAIMLARKYATDRAPSLKMLFEYLAMSVGK